MPPPEKTAKGFMPSLSKISPPASSKILPRPRLLELFEKSEDKKLILIIGQAAQGKSTLAAWYFRETKRPSIWINLGPEDSDPVNLFYLLVQAVKNQLREMDSQPLLSLPSQSLGPREASYHYREWAAALFAALDTPFQIFIDGLDRLTPDAKAFPFLQILIEQQPPSLRLILLSRAYPPLSLEFQNLKMGRQALVLENEDLAFTPQEIRQYFKELHDLSLNKDQVERIYKSTEGWIGGINLLSQTLEKIPGDSLTEYLAATLPPHFNRETFQYFGKEVFSALTLPQQDFLLRSSILDRLDPGLIRVFSPKEDGQAFLKEMVQKNIFVQAYQDQSRGVVFRYHQLFKDFLQSKLRSQVSEEELRQLHRTAGAYYKKKGDGEAALKHYLEAGSYPEAAALIKQIGLDLIKKARTADLSRWLEELPKPFIREDAWLLLLRCLTQRFIPVEENMLDSKKAVALFKKQGDISGLLLGTAFLIEAEISGGKYSPELIREAEELLKSIDPSLYLYERAVLWSQIGLFESLRGNARRGYWACQNAYLLANQLADPLLQVGALTHALTCLTTLGEFRQAERLLKEMDPLLWRFKQGEIRSFYSLSKILFLIFRGDTQASLDLCEVCLEEAERQGLAQAYPIILFHKQIALVSARRYDQAGQIHGQLLNLASLMNSGFLRAVTTLFAGVSAYWAGGRSEALGLVDQAVALLTEGDSRSESHLPAARLARCLLNNNPETRREAIREVREVLEHFERQENRLWMTECRLSLGILYQAAGQDDQAAVHLQEGLKIARQRNYRHFIIISPSDTVRACLLAQEYFEEGNDLAEYASALVIQKFGRLAEEELEKLSLHPNPKVSRKSWEIQRAIHRAETPLLRIETFGGLRLYFDDKKMVDKAWDRFQPGQLLMAILSQKIDKIPKEVLIEALWPEEKPGSGEKNFKTALQRLRKFLEADLSTKFGSSYIHLHRNLVFLDEELCRVDSRQFTFLGQEGKKKGKNGDAKGALECFSEAVELYQGDFIPEERYALWADNRREELKNGYLDLLTRTAHYHEQAGSFKKAVACLKQALEADPLMEEVYRRLMTLYAGKKLYNEALRVFESCKKALRAGLDTQPDPVTVTLYLGIKGQQKKS